MDHKDESLFVLQSGIVAWEDPAPLADWTKKTVSVIYRTPPVAMSLLWTIIDSRPQPMTRVVRLYLAPLSAGLSSVQRRRLFTELERDPPGFVQTVMKLADTHACITSSLSDRLAVSSGFLTDYRRCALLELANSNTQDPEPFDRMCKTIEDLGSSGIGTLLSRIENSAALRVLDLESYSVVQLIGSAEVVDLAVACLVRQGIRRLHDVRTIAQEIAALQG